MLDKRIMGLDYGSKTIGVAVSDLLGMTAQGIETININEQVKDFKIKRIKELVNEYNIGKIVVGLPKNMDNSIGFRGEATLYFVEVLKKKIKSVEVILQDEQWERKEYFLKLMFQEKNVKMLLIKWQQFLYYKLI